MTQNGHGFFKGKHFFVSFDLKCAKIRAGVAKLTPLYCYKLSKTLTLTNCLLKPKCMLTFTSSKDMRHRKLPQRPRGWLGAFGFFSHF